MGCGGMGGSLPSVGSKLQSLAKLARLQRGQRESPCAADLLQGLTPPPAWPPTGHAEAAAQAPGDGLVVRELARRARARMELASESRRDRSRLQLASEPVIGRHTGVGTPRTKRAVPTLAEGRIVGWAWERWRGHAAVARRHFFIVMTLIRRRQQRCLREWRGMASLVRSAPTPNRSECGPLEGRRGPNMVMRRLVSLLKRRQARLFRRWLASAQISCATRQAQLRAVADTARRCAEFAFNGWRGVVQLRAWGLWAAGRLSKQRQRRVLIRWREVSVHSVTRRKQRCKDLLSSFQSNRARIALLDWRDAAVLLRQLTNLEAELTICHQHRVISRIFCIWTGLTRRAALVHSIERGQRNRITGRVLVAWVVETDATRRRAAILDAILKLRLNACMRVARRALVHWAQLSSDAVMGRQLLQLQAAWIRWGQKLRQARHWMDLAEMFRVKCSEERMQHIFCRWFARSIIRTQARALTSRRVIRRAHNTFRHWRGVPFARSELLRIALARYATRITAAHFGAWRYAAVAGHQNRVCALLQFRSRRFANTFSVWHRVARRRQAARRHAVLFQKVVAHRRQHETLEAWFCAQHLSQIQTALRLGTSERCFRAWHRTAIIFAAMHSFSNRWRTKTIMYILCGWKQYTQRAVWARGAARLQRILKQERAMLCCVVEWRQYTSRRILGRVACQLALHRTVQTALCSWWKLIFLEAPADRLRFRQLSKWVFRRWRCSARALHVHKKLCWLHSARVLRAWRRIAREIAIARRMVLLAAHIAAKQRCKRSLRAWTQFCDRQSRLNRCLHALRLRILLSAFEAFDATWCMSRRSSAAASHHFRVAGQLRPKFWAWRRFALAQREATELRLLATAVARAKCMQNGFCRWRRGAVMQQLIRARWLPAYQAFSRAWSSLLLKAVLGSWISYYENTNWANAERLQLAKRIRRAQIITRCWIWWRCRNSATQAVQRPANATNLGCKKTTMSGVQTNSNDRNDMSHSFQNSDSNSDAISFRTVNSCEDLLQDLTPPPPWPGTNVHKVDTSRVARCLNLELGIEQQQETSMDSDRGASSTASSPSVCSPTVSSPFHPSRMFGYMEPITMDDSDWFKFDELDDTARLQAHVLISEYTRVARRSVHAAHLACKMWTTRIQRQAWYSWIGALRLTLVHEQRAKSFYRGRLLHLVFCALAESVMMRCIESGKH